jgi:hypothetical protein
VGGRLIFERLIEKDVEGSDRDLFQGLFRYLPEGIDQGKGRNIAG